MLSSLLSSRPLSLYETCGFFLDKEVNILFDGLAFVLFHTKSSEVTLSTSFSKQSSIELRDAFLDRLMAEQRMLLISVRFLSLFFLPEEGWDEEVIKRVDEALQFMSVKATKDQRICFMSRVRSELPVDFEKAGQFEQMLRPFVTDCRMASLASFDFLVIMAAFQRSDLLSF